MFDLTQAGGRTLRGRLLGYDKGITKRTFWAVRHVNFEIEPGEAFAIVGRNGSGKSTILKMLARIYGPSEGRCEVGGRMSSLLELGAGFHPEFNALENIYLSAAIYGIPREEIDKERDAIIEFAELEEFAHQPVKTFSSGMFARLGFSVAMHVKPDVLLLDEVLAVGDEAFVHKCMGRIGEYRREGGTMILVTHDASTVERMCSRALYLREGEPRLLGPAHDVITAYHDDLAAEDTSAPTPGAGSAETDAITLTATLTDLDGEQRHRFTEGEGFAVDLTLTPTRDIPPVTVTVSIADELDREIGSTSLENPNLETGRTTTTRVEFPDPPLRNGQFQIGVQITNRMTGQLLLDAEAVESLSVMGQEAHQGGPVRLRGVWGGDRAAR